MNKAYQMAEYRAKFPENSFRSIGKDYYQWKTYGSPYPGGEIFLYQLDGKIVGSATIMPRKVAIYKDVFLGAEIGDSFTLPEYRGQGINTAIFKQGIDYAVLNGNCVIYGPPNKANSRTASKLDCLPVTYAKWAFLTKVIYPPIFLVKLIGKIVTGRNIYGNYKQLTYTIKKIIQRQYGSSYKEKVVDFEVSEIHKFREDLDPLWGKARFSFCIYRDAEYLNWRYFECPDTYTVLAAQKDNEYLGYIVLKGIKGNNTWIMCDFITYDDREDVYTALLKTSEKIVKQKGGKEINVRCISNNMYHEKLMNYGYYDHGPKFFHPVHLYKNTDIGKMIHENPGKWHFTLGDTDDV